MPFGAAGCSLTRVHLGVGTAMAGTPLSLCLAWCEVGGAMSSDFPRLPIGGLPMAANITVTEPQVLSQCGVEARASRRFPPPSTGIAVPAPLSCILDSTRES